MMLGDEAYAGSRNFSTSKAAVQKYYGYRYIVPTHQGRGRREPPLAICIKPGDYVPGNMYFTTTRHHQELAGATFVDIMVDEAHDPSVELPLQGQRRPRQAQPLIDEVGPEKIPYVCVAGTVNMAGGQPISMTNMRPSRRCAPAHGIR
jgi:tyrosine phenol-lyase